MTLIGGMLFGKIAPVEKDSAGIYEKLIPIKYIAYICMLMHLCCALLNMLHSLIVIVWVLKKCSLFWEKSGC